MRGELESESERSVTPPYSPPQGGWGAPPSLIEMGSNRSGDWRSRGGRVDKYINGFIDTVLNTHMHMRIEEFYFSVLMINNIKTYFFLYFL